MMVCFYVVHKTEKKFVGKLLGSGLPGSFGAVTGYLAFDVDTIQKMHEESKTCILYRKYATIDDSIDYNVRVLFELVFLASHLFV
jgi:hypothetical protein